jgi:hypothetical protein
MKTVVIALLCGGRPRIQLEGIAGPILSERYACRIMDEAPLLPPGAFS